MGFFSSLSTSTYCGTAFVFLFLASPASADVPLKKTLPVRSTISASPWVMDFGLRYWVGGGKYRMDLFNNGISSLVSRLIYDGFTSNAAEGFWRIDHEKGIFIKGYFGGGSNNNGELIDEDFPPGIIYSRTVSEQKNGALDYFSADLGYNLFKKSNWQLGVFTGFHYWLEHYNSFGCTQTVGGTVCSTPIPSSVDALNDNLTWNSLRLGMNSMLRITDTLNLVTDVAYTRGSLRANDYHNLRPSIRGVPEDGSGNGVQLDTLVNWKLNSALSVGIGGRWWHISTKGNANFDQTAGGGEPQPITLTQDSYGLLLQTSYNFERDTFLSSILSKPTGRTTPNWQGFYIGANIGYGMSSDNVYISALSTQAMSIANDIPPSLNTQALGFLGGGQMGYNWIMEKTLLGMESDLGYAHIGGANANTLAHKSTSISKNISWVGTVRGRVGKLASKKLLGYLTAGPAIGGTNLAFDQRQLTSNCLLSLCSTANTAQTRIGWTAGGGIEYAVSDRATYKAEYLYVDLGNSSLNAEGSFNVNSNFQSNLMRLGFNYKI